MSNRIRKIIFIFYLFFSFFVVRRYIQKYLTKYIQRSIFIYSQFGSLAQLVERVLCMHEVGGSKPPISTFFFNKKRSLFFLKQGIIIYFTTQITQITQLVYSTLIRKLILVVVRSLITSCRRCKR